MPIDPDVEDRFQKFIAEPAGSRKQPKTAEEREALAKLLAQESRSKLPSGGQYNLPKARD
jgi:hypothetical protein